MTAIGSATPLICIAVLLLAVVVPPAAQQGGGCPACECPQNTVSVGVLIGACVAVLVGTLIFEALAILCYRKYCRDREKLPKVAHRFMISPGKELVVKENLAYKSDSEAQERSLRAAKEQKRASIFNISETKDNLMYVPALYRNPISKDRDTGNAIMNGYHDHEPDFDMDNIYTYNAGWGSRVPGLLSGKARSESLEDIYMDTNEFPILRTPYDDVGPVNFASSKYRNGFGKKSIDVHEDDGEVTTYTYSTGFGGKKRREVATVTPDDGDDVEIKGERVTWRRSKRPQDVILAMDEEEAEPETRIAIDDNFTIGRPASTSRREYTTAEIHSDTPGTSFDPSGNFILRATPPASRSDSSDDDLYDYGEGSDKQQQSLNMLRHTTPGRIGHGTYRATVGGIPLDRSSSDENETPTELFNSRYRYSTGLNKAKLVAMRAAAAAHAREGIINEEDPSDNPDDDQPVFGYIKLVRPDNESRPDTESQPDEPTTVQLHPVGSSGDPVTIHKRHSQGFGRNSYLRHRRESYVEVSDAQTQCEILRIDRQHQEGIRRTSILRNSTATHSQHTGSMDDIPTIGVIRLMQPKTSYKQVRIKENSEEIQQDTLSFSEEDDIITTSLEDISYRSGSRSTDRTATRPRRARSAPARSQHELETTSEYPFEEVPTIGVIRLVRPESVSDSSGVESEMTSGEESAPEEGPHGQSNKWTQHEVPIVRLAQQILQESIQERNSTRQSLHRMDQGTDEIPTIGVVRLVRPKSTVRERPTVERQLTTSHETRSSYRNTPVTDMPTIGVIKLMRRDSTRSPTSQANALVVDRGTQPEHTWGQILHEMQSMVESEILRKTSKRGHAQPMEDLNESTRTLGIIKLRRGDIVQPQMSRNMVDRSMQCEEKETRDEATNPSYSWSHLVHEVEDQIERRYRRMSAPAIATSTDTSAAQSVQKLGVIQLKAAPEKIIRDSFTQFSGPDTYEKCTGPAWSFTDIKEEIEEEAVRKFKKTLKGLERPSETQEFHEPLRSVSVIKLKKQPQQEKLVRDSVTQTYTSNSYEKSTGPTWSFGELQENIEEEAIRKFKRTLSQLDRPSEATVGHQPIQRVSVIKLKKEPTAEMPTSVERGIQPDMRWRELKEEIEDEAIDEYKKHMRRFQPKEEPLEQITRDTPRVSVIKLKGAQSRPLPDQSDNITQCELIKPKPSMADQVTEPSRPWSDVLHNVRRILENKYRRTIHELETRLTSVPKEESVIPTVAVFKLKEPEEKPDLPKAVMVDEKMQAAPQMAEQDTSPERPWKHVLHDLKQILENDYRHTIRELEDELNGRDEPDTGKTIASFKLTAPEIPKVQTVSMYTQAEGPLTGEQGTIPDRSWDSIIKDVRSSVENEYRVTVKELESQLEERSQKEAKVPTRLGIFKLKAPKQAKIKKPTLHNSYTQSDSPQIASKATQPLKPWLSLMNEMEEIIEEKFLKKIKPKEVEPEIVKQTTETLNLAPQLEPVTETASTASQTKSVKTVSLSIEAKIQPDTVEQGTSCDLSKPAVNELVQTEPQLRNVHTLTDSFESSDFFQVFKPELTSQEIQAIPSQTTASTSYLKSPVKEFGVQVHLEVLTDHLSVSDFGVQVDLEPLPQFPIITPTVIQPVNAPVVFKDPEPEKIDFACQVMPQSNSKASATEQVKSLDNFVQVGDPIPSQMEYGVQVKPAVSDNHSSTSLEMVNVGTNNEFKVPSRDQSTETVKELLKSPVKEFGVQVLTDQPSVSDFGLQVDLEPLPQFPIITPTVIQPVNAPVVFKDLEPEKIDFACQVMPQSNSKASATEQVKSLDNFVQVGDPIPSQMECGVQVKPAVSDNHSSTSLEMVNVGTNNEFKVPSRDQSTETVKELLKSPVKEFGVQVLTDHPSVSDFGLQVDLEPLPQFPIITPTVIQPVNAPVVFKDLEPEKIDFACQVMPQSNSKASATEQVKSLDNFVQVGDPIPSQMECGVQVKPAVSDNHSSTSLKMVDVGTNNEFKVPSRDQSTETVQELLNSAIQVGPEVKSRAAATDRKKYSDAFSQVQESLIETVDFGISPPVVNYVDKNSQMYISTFNQQIQVRSQQSDASTEKVLQMSDTATEPQITTRNDAAVQVLMEIETEPAIIKAVLQNEQYAMPSLPISIETVDSETQTMQQTAEFSNQFEPATSDQSTEKTIGGSNVALQTSPHGTDSSTETLQVVTKAVLVQVRPRTTDIATEYELQPRGVDVETQYNIDSRDIAVSAETYMIEEGTSTEIKAQLQVSTQTELEITPEPAIIQEVVQTQQAVSFLKVETSEADTQTASETKQEGTSTDGIKTADAMIQHAHVAVSVDESCQVTPSVVANGTAAFTKDIITRATQAKPETTEHGMTTVIHGSSERSSMANLLPRPYQKPLTKDASAEMKPESKLKSQGTSAEGANVKAASVQVSPAMTTRGQTSKPDFNDQWSMTDELPQKEVFEIIVPHREQPVEAQIPTLDAELVDKTTQVVIISKDSSSYTELSQVQASTQYDYNCTETASQSEPQAQSSSRGTHMDKHLTDGTSQTKSVQNESIGTSAVVTRLMTSSAQYEPLRFRSSVSNQTTPSTTSTGVSPEKIDTTTSSTQYQEQEIAEINIFEELVSMEEIPTLESPLQYPDDEVTTTDNSSQTEAQTLPSTKDTGSQHGIETKNSHVQSLRVEVQSKAIFTDSQLKDTYVQYDGNLFRTTESSQTSIPLRTTGSSTTNKSVTTTGVSPDVIEVKTASSQCHMTDAQDQCIQTEEQDEVPFVEELVTLEEVPTVEHMPEFPPVDLIDAETQVEQVTKSDQGILTRVESKDATTSTPIKRYSEAFAQNVPHLKSVSQQKNNERPGSRSQETSMERINVQSKPAQVKPSTKSFEQIIKPEVSDQGTMADIEPETIEPQEPVQMQDADTQAEMKLEMKDMASWIQPETKEVPSQMEVKHTAAFAQAVVRQYTSSSQTTESPKSSQAATGFQTDTMVEVTDMEVQTNPVTIIDFVPVLVDSTVQYEPVYYYSASTQIDIPTMHQQVNATVPSTSQETETIHVKKNPSSSQTETLRGEDNSSQTDPPPEPEPFIIPKTVAPVQFATPLIPPDTKAVETQTSTSSTDCGTSIIAPKLISSHVQVRPQSSDAATETPTKLSLTKGVQEEPSMTSQVLQANPEVREGSTETEMKPVVDSTSQTDPMPEPEPLIAPITLQPVHLAPPSLLPEMLVANTQTESVKNVHHGTSMQLPQLHDVTTMTPVKHYVPIAVQEQPTMQSQLLQANPEVQVASTETEMNPAVENSSQTDPLPEPEPFIVPITLEPVHLAPPSLLPEMLVAKTQTENTQIIHQETSMQSPQLHDVNTMTPVKHYVQRAVQEKPSMQSRILQVNPEVRVGSTWTEINPSVESTSQTEINPAEDRSSQTDPLPKPEPFIVPITLKPLHLAPQSLLPEMLVANTQTESANIIHQGTSMQLPQLHDVNTMTPVKHYVPKAVQEQPSMQSQLLQAKPEVRVGSTSTENPAEERSSQTDPLPEPEPFIVPVTLEPVHLAPPSLLPEMLVANTQTESANIVHQGTSMQLPQLHDMNTMTPIKHYVPKAVQEEPSRQSQVLQANPEVRVGSTETELNPSVESTSQTEINPAEERSSQTDPLPEPEPLIAPITLEPVYLAPPSLLPEMLVANTQTESAKIVDQETSMQLPQLHDVNTMTPVKYYVAKAVQEQPTMQSQVLQVHPEVRVGSTSTEINPTMESPSQTEIGPAVERTSQTDPLPEPEPLITPITLEPVHLEAPPLLPEMLVAESQTERADFVDKTTSMEFSKVQSTHVQVKSQTHDMNTMTPVKHYVPKAVQEQPTMQSQALQVYPEVRVGSTWTEVNPTIESTSQTEIGPAVEGSSQTDPLPEPEPLIAPITLQPVHLAPPSLLPEMLVANTQTESAKIIHQETSMQSPQLHDMNTMTPIKHYVPKAVQEEPSMQSRVLQANPEVRVVSTLTEINPSVESTSQTEINTAEDRSSQTDPLPEPEPLITPITLEPVHLAPPTLLPEMFVANTQTESANIVHQGTSMQSPQLHSVHTMTPVKHYVQKAVQEQPPMRSEVLQVNPDVRVGSTWTEMNPSEDGSSQTDPLPEPEPITLQPLHFAPPSLVPEMLVAHTQTENAEIVNHGTSMQSPQLHDVNTMTPVKHYVSKAVQEQPTMRSEVLQVIPEVRVGSTETEMNPAVERSSQTDPLPEPEPLITPITLEPVYLPPPSLLPEMLVAATQTESTKIVHQGTLMQGPKLYSNHTQVSLQMRNTSTLTCPLDTVEKAVQEQPSLDSRLTQARPDVRDSATWFDSYPQIEQSSQTDPLPKVEPFIAPTRTEPVYFAPTLLPEMLVAESQTAAIHQVDHETSMQLPSLFSSYVQVSPKMVDTNTMTQPRQNTTKAAQIRPDTLSQIMQTSPDVREDAVLTENLTTDQESQHESSSSDVSLQVAPKSNDASTLVKPDVQQLSEAETQHTVESSDSKCQTELTIEDLEEMLAELKQKLEEKPMIQEFVIPEKLSPVHAPISYPIDKSDSAIQTFLETVQRSTSPILQEVKDVITQYESELRDVGAQVKPDVLDQQLETFVTSVQDAAIQYESELRDVGAQVKPDVLDQQLETFVTSVQDAAIQYESELRDVGAQVKPDVLDQQLQTFVTSVQDAAIQYAMLYSEDKPTQFSPDIRNMGSNTTRREYQESCTNTEVTSVSSKTIEAYPDSRDKATIPMLTEFDKRGTQTAAVEHVSRWSQNEVTLADVPIQADGPILQDALSQTDTILKEDIEAMVKPIERREVRLEMRSFKETNSIEIQTDPVIIKSAEPDDESKSWLDSGIDTDVQTDPIVILSDVESEIDLLDEDSQTIEVDMIDADIQVESSPLKDTTSQTTFDTTAKTVQTEPKQVSYVSTITMPPAVKQISAQTVPTKTASKGLQFQPVPHLKEDTDTQTPSIPNKEQGTHVFEHLFQSSATQTDAMPVIEPEIIHVASLQPLESPITFPTPEAEVTDAEIQASVGVTDGDSQTAKVQTADRPSSPGISYSTAESQTTVLMQNRDTQFESNAKPKKTQTDSKIIVNMGTVTDNVISRDICLQAMLESKPENVDRSIQHATMVLPGYSQTEDTEQQHEGTQTDKIEEEIQYILPIPAAHETSTQTEFDYSDTDAQTENPVTVEKGADAAVTRVTSVSLQAKPTTRQQVGTSQTERLMTRSKATDTEPKHSVSMSVQTDMIPVRIVDEHVSPVYIQPVHAPLKLPEFKPDVQDSAVQTSVKTNDESMQHDSENTQFNIFSKRIVKGEVTPTVFSEFSLTPRKKQFISHLETTSHEQKEKLTFRRSVDTAAQVKPEMDDVPVQVQPIQDDQATTTDMPICKNTEAQTDFIIEPMEEVIRVSHVPEQQAPFLDLGPILLDTGTQVKPKTKEHGVSASLPTDESYLDLGPMLLDTGTQARPKTTEHGMLTLVPLEPLPAWTQTEIKTNDTAAQHEFDVENATSQTSIDQQEQSTFTYVYVCPEGSQATVDMKDAVVQAKTEREVSVMTAGIQTVVIYEEKPAMVDSGIQFKPLNIDQATLTSKPQKFSCSSNTEPINRRQAMVQVTIKPETQVRGTLTTPKYSKNITTQAKPASYDACVQHDDLPDQADKGLQIKPLMLDDSSETAQLQLFDRPTQVDIDALKPLTSDVSIQLDQKSTEDKISQIKPAVAETGVSTEVITKDMANQADLPLEVEEFIRPDTMEIQHAPLSFPVETLDRSVQHQPSYDVHSVQISSEVTDRASSPVGPDYTDGYSQTKADTSSVGLQTHAQETSVSGIQAVMYSAEELLHLEALDEEQQIVSYQDAQVQYTPHTEDSTTETVSMSIDFAVQSQPLAIEQGTITDIIKHSQAEVQVDMGRPQPATQETAVQHDRQFKQVDAFTQFQPLTVEEGTSAIPLRRTEASVQCIAPREKEPQSPKTKKKVIEKGTSTEYVTMQSSTQTVLLKSDVGMQSKPDTKSEQTLAVLKPDSQDQSSGTMQDVCTSETQTSFPNKTKGSQCDRATMVHNNSQYEQMFVEDTSVQVKPVIREQANSPIFKRKEVGHASSQTDAVQEEIDSAVENLMKSAPYQPFKSTLDTDYMNDYSSKLKEYLERDDNMADFVDYRPIERLEAVQQQQERSSPVYDYAGNFSSRLYDTEMTETTDVMERLVTSEVFLHIEEPITKDETDGVMSEPRFYVESSVQTGDVYTKDRSTSPLFQPTREKQSQIDIKVGHSDTNVQVSPTMTSESSYTTPVPTNDFSSQADFGTEEIPVHDASTQYCTHVSHVSAQVQPSMRDASVTYKVANAPVSTQVKPETFEQGTSTPKQQKSTSDMQTQALPDAASKTTSPLAVRKNQMAVQTKIDQHDSSSQYDQVQHAEAVVQTSQCRLEKGTSTKPDNRDISIQANPTLRHATSQYENTIKTVDFMVQYRAPHLDSSTQSTETKTPCQDRASSPVHTDLSEVEKDPFVIQESPVQPVIFQPVSSSIIDPQPFEQHDTEIREQEIRDKIRLEVIEDVQQMVREEFTERIREEVREEVRQEVRQEIIEEIREETTEDIRKVVREELMYEMNSQLEIKTLCQDRASSPIHTELSEVERDPFVTQESPVQPVIFQPVSSSIMDLQPFEQHDTEIREQEIRDKIRLEVIEDVQQMVREEFTERIREEVREEVRQEVRQEIIEEIREETTEDIRKVVREELMYEMNSQLEIKTLCQDRASSPIHTELSEVERDPFVIQESPVQPVIFQPVSSSIMDLQPFEQHDTEIREQEIRDRLRLEVIEDVQQMVREEFTEHIREEVIMEVREEVRQEIIEEIREETTEDIRQEVREELMNEMNSQLEAEVRDGLRLELEITVREELKEEYIEEYKEEILIEIKEDLKIEFGSRIRLEIEEHTRDDLEFRIRGEMEPRIRRDLEPIIRREIEQEYVKETIHEVRVEAPVMYQPTEYKPEPIKPLMLDRGTSPVVTKSRDAPVQVRSVTHDGSSQCDKPKPVDSVTQTRVSTVERGTIPHRSFTSDVPVQAKPNLVHHGTSPILMPHRDSAVQAEVQKADKGGQYKALPSQSDVAVQFSRVPHTVGVLCQVQPDTVEQGTSAETVKTHQTYIQTENPLKKSENTQTCTENIDAVCQSEPVFYSDRMLQVKPIMFDKSTLTQPTEVAELSTQVELLDIIKPVEEVPVKVQDSSVQHEPNTEVTDRQVQAGPVVREQANSPFTLITFDMIAPQRQGTIHVPPYSVHPRDVSEERTFISEVITGEKDLHVEHTPTLFASQASSFRQPYTSADRPFQSPTLEPQVARLDYVPLRTTDLNTFQTVPSYDRSSLEYTSRLTSDVLNAMPPRCEMVLLQTQASGTTYTSAFRTSAQTSTQLSSGFNLPRTSIKDYDKPPGSFEEAKSPMPSDTDSDSFPEINELERIRRDLRLSKVIVTDDQATLVGYWVKGDDDRSMYTPDLPADSPFSSPDYSRFDRPYSRSEHGSPSRFGYTPRSPRIGSQHFMNLEHGPKEVIPDVIMDDPTDDFPVVTEESNWFRRETSAYRLNVPYDKKGSPHPGARIVYSLSPYQSPSPTPGRMSPIHMSPEHRLSVEKLPIPRGMVTRLSDLLTGELSSDDDSILPMSRLSELIEKHRELSRPPKWTPGSSFILRDLETEPDATDSDTDTESFNAVMDLSDPFLHEDPNFWPRYQSDYCPSSTNSDVSSDDDTITVYGDCDVQDFDLPTSLPQTTKSPRDDTILPGEPPRKRRSIKIDRSRVREELSMSEVVLPEGPPRLTGYRMNMDVSDWQRDWPNTRLSRSEPDLYRATTANMPIPSLPTYANAYPYTSHGLGRRHPDPEHLMVDAGAMPALSAEIRYAKVVEKRNTSHLQWSQQGRLSTSDPDLTSQHGRLFDVGQF